MAARPVVLVVDDDMDTNDSLTDALAREGYSCIGAPDGNRALVLTQQHRPDLVLLDLGLPGMSGIEFLIEKSEMPAVADIPVIVMTGMTGDCKGVLPALCQQCLDVGTECARWACHAPFARSEHRSPRRPRRRRPASFQPAAPTRDRLLGRPRLAAKRRVRPARAPRRLLRRPALQRRRPGRDPACLAGPAGEEDDRRHHRLDRRGFPAYRGPLSVRPSRSRRAQRTRL